MGGGGNHHQTKISTKYDKYADTTIHLDEQIEKHAYYRENLHKKFRWNRFSITRLFVWCFVIPLAIYQGTKIEYVSFIFLFSLGTRL